MLEIFIAATPQHVLPCAVRLSVCLPWRSSLDTTGERAESTFSLFGPEWRPACFADAINAVDSPDAAMRTLHHMILAL
jgi:hypothetical protein